MRALLFKLLLPVIAVIGVVNPFYGFCVYWGFNIIRPEMFFWGGHSANIVFKVSLIATLIGYFRLRSNPRSLFSYPDFWLFLWLWAACAISLLLSNYPLEPRAWYYSNEILKLWGGACICLGVVYSKEHIVKIQSLTLVCISFLAVWAIEQHFRGNERLEGLGGSAYGDSNGVASVGVLFFSIALNNAITASDKKKKFVWVFSSAVIAAMIVFTQSRGGFLGMLAGFLYLLFATRKKKTLIIGAVLVSLFAVPFAAKEYIHRVETITANDEERDMSAGSRLVLWRAGVLMFQDNPFFGVGLLNFAKVKNEYKNQLVGKVDSDLLEYSFRGYKVGHGTYFTELLAEGGLFLTVPYLWLIFGFLIRARRIRRKNNPHNFDQSFDLLAGMEAGVVGHCVSIMFINALFMYFLPIQLLFGRQLVRALENEALEKPQGSVE